jgi:hypothetical protein
MASKPGCVNNFGISLAEDPLTGQAVSGVKVARVWSAAATRNVGRRVRYGDLLPERVVGGERECVEQQKL